MSDARRPHCARVRVTMRSKFGKLFVFVLIFVCICICLYLSSQCVSDARRPHCTRVRVTMRSKREGFL